MNKNYLKYLIRNYRVALLFYAVVAIGISSAPLITSDGSFGNYSVSIQFMLIMSIVMTYVLPVLLFSFVHRRRSADLYFALPISRKEQLITNLLFAFGCIFGVFVLGAFILYIPSASAVRFVYVLKMIAAAALCFASLILIHSAWNLIANNLFDGIVMIAAWSVLPLLIYLAITSFASTMVAGQSTHSIPEIGMWLSPLAMSIRNLFNVSDEILEPSIPYFILIALWGVIGAIGCGYHFINRKSERAEQLSDDPLAYPLIINTYAFGILIMLADEFVSERSMELISLYLLLLFVYVVAQFVYRRKIRITPKILITFGLWTAAAFVFASTAFYTRGFGLADRYSINDNTHIKISYNATVFRDDLTQPAVYEETLQDQTVYLEAQMFMPVAEYVKDENLYNALEKYRRAGIDAFYSGKTEYNLGLMFTNCSGQGYDYTNNYSYFLNEAITLDDLKTIDKSPYASVTIWDPTRDSTLTLTEWLNQKGK